MKSLRNTFKYIVFLGLGLGIFFYVYPVDEIKIIWQKLKEANYIFLFPMGILAIASHYSRGLRWKMLIDPLGYKVRGFSAFRGVMIGYYFNTLVPRMGEVSRCVALKKIDKVPVSSSLGTVITERIFDLIMLIIVVGAAILLEFDVIGEYVIDSFTSKLESSSGLLSITTLLFVLASVGGLFVVYYALKKLGILDKILGLLNQFKEGVISVRKLKNPLAFVGHTVFIWASYLTTCYLVFYTYDETATLGVKEALAVFALGTIGFIAPVPGGIGTYQIMFALGLSFYLIDETTAKSVAMISFMANTVLNLIVGAIMLNFSPEKLNINAQQAEE